MQSQEAVLRPKSLLEQEEAFNEIIRVSRVKRDVAVDRDGSGEIVVQDVDGNLSVGKDGSGGIRHKRVGGSISLPDDES
jgi:hypothetical protein